MVADAEQMPDLQVLPGLLKSRQTETTDALLLVGCQSTQVGCLVSLAWWGCQQMVEEAEQMAGLEAVREGEVEAASMAIGDREADERELLEAMEEQRRGTLGDLTAEESKRRAQVRLHYEDLQHVLGVRRWCSARGPFCC